MINTIDVQIVFKDDVNREFKFVSDRVTLGYAMDNVKDGVTEAVNLRRFENNVERDTVVLNSDGTWYYRSPSMILFKENIP